MADADFLTLARDTFKDDGSVDIEKGDLLWAALFQLPQWYFLMTPKSAEAQQPSAQRIDGKVWYLAFTDRDKLKFYAESNKNLAANGDALFLAMSPAEAVEFADSSRNQNVYGIRFNERQKHGWFSPMENIADFPAYLKGKGLI
ncbi:MAG: hypothetical protein JSR44_12360 [Spirochaetes bacterium]|nr:hypothetical protein [Spirochaetota bacterium]